VRLCVRVLLGLEVSCGSLFVDIMRLFIRARTELESGAVVSDQDSFLEKLLGLVSQKESLIALKKVGKGPVPLTTTC
jgi:hypothetical protein